MVTSTELSLGRKFGIMTVVITVVIFFSLYQHFKNDSVAAHDMLVKQKEEYERTISELNKIHDDERLALQKNQQELELKLEEEKRKYEIIIDELKKKKNDKIKKIIEEHGNDPEALTNLMIEHFNLRR